MKLVGFINTLAAGSHGHRVQASDIGALCEVIVERLQTFPAPPTPYRPQRSEPEPLGGSRVRIISGFSGAGKTAWAETKARAVESAMVYFDAAGIPQANVPMSLARELTARFIDDPRERTGLFVGVNAGTDVLRAVARRMAESRAGPILVFDNAHLLDPDTIVNLARALEPVRLVLLSRPTPALPLLEALLSADVQYLRGWDDDTVAQEVAEQGARADASAVARLSLLTGALPLFVATAAGLATVSYDGEVAALCTALEDGTTIHISPQDLVLQRFVATLSPHARSTMALLGLAEVPLTRDKAIAFARSRLDNDAIAADSLRTLLASYVVQQASGGKLHLHDAFRPLALAALAMLGTDAAVAARVALRDILVESLARSGDVDRLRLWMRLAAQTGDIDTLTDVALDEMIHQIGGPDVVRTTLEVAAASDDLDD